MKPPVDAKVKRRNRRLVLLLIIVALAVAFVTMRGIYLSDILGIKGSRPPEKETSREY